MIITMITITTIINPTTIIIIHHGNVLDVSELFPSEPEDFAIHEWLSDEIVTI
jgi:hypothetical protein